MGRSGCAGRGAGSNGCRVVWDVNCSGIGIGWDFSNWKVWVWRGIYECMNAESASGSRGASVTLRLVDLCEGEISRAARYASRVCCVRTQRWRWWRFETLGRCDELTMTIRLHDEDRLNRPPHVFLGSWRKEAPHIARLRRRRRDMWRVGLWGRDMWRGGQWGRAMWRGGQ